MNPLAELGQAVGQPHVERRCLAYILIKKTGTELLEEIAFFLEKRNLYFKKLTLWDDSVRNSYIMLT